MQFHPIFRRESAVDACAEALRRAILSGALRPGQRLPPERTLADDLGVNRVTVRSALAQLAQASLVSVRQGSGYVVQDYRATGGPDLLPGLLALGAEHGDIVAIAKDLLLVRRHLARAVLERLAATADDDGLRGIVDAVDRFAERITGGPDEVARADLDVLSALLDATKSPVLRLCLNPVLTVVTSMPDLRAALYAEPEGNLLGWRALVAWLASVCASRASRTRKSTTNSHLEDIDTILAEVAQRDLVTLSRLRSAHTSP